MKRIRTYVRRSFVLPGTYVRSASVAGTALRTLEGCASVAGRRKVARRARARARPYLRKHAPVVPCVLLVFPPAIFSLRTCVLPWSSSSPWPSSPSSPSSSPFLLLLRVRRCSSSSSSSPSSSSSSSSPVVFFSAGPFPPPPPPPSLPHPSRASEFFRQGPGGFQCFGRASEMRTLPLGPPAELPIGPSGVRGVCPKRAGGRMRTLPLRPSVELPLGRRSM